MNKSFAAFVLLMSLPGAARAESLKASAALKPASNATTEGNIFFEETKDGKVRITGDVRNLEPGMHGIHVHEKGDCGAPGSDAKAAGDHFNPAGAPHAGKEDSPRHAGDLGNLVADAKGKARVDAEDELLKLRGENSIVGRTLIVHAKRDDLKTQPAGGSGERIACGVITLSK